MPRCCVWTAVVGLLLVFTLIDQNDALTPFQVTYEPSHVVRHVTEHITVRCAHDDYKSPSQLSEISRIRMLKKSPSGWQLLAELRDNEDKPNTNINVAVSANINWNIRDTFIEIVWPVATDDTFGIYRCDVIGFDKTTFQNTAEVTPIVQLVEESVTTNDMLAMFLETKAELHQVEVHEDHLEVDVAALDKNLSDIGHQVRLQGEDVSQLDGHLNAASQSLNLVAGDFANLKGHVSSIKPEFDSVDENTKKIDYLNSNIESVRHEVSSRVDNRIELQYSGGSFGTLMSWPAGRYALLQPKSGCPVDLTFFGGSASYWQIHTESSSGSANRNAHSDVFLPGTLSTTGENNFATLKFCEANGILNTASWPSGSYCINRIFDVPCPSGFQEGEIQLDVEDTLPVIEYTSRSILGGHSILFCCMSSGDSTAEIALPTHSPFLLYRRGGQCQKVNGMSVHENNVIVDTENTVNKDQKLDNWPDVDIHASGDSIMKFHLCYYESV